MTFTYALRPIEDRTWMRPESKRTRSPYTAGWSKTADLLARELRHLHARNVVLQADCTESQLRLDGRLRAGARLASDAVVLAFDSDHGAVSWRSDAFNAVGYSSPSGTQGWHHNLRAIGLTLEALRAVDRYGVSDSGQQYTGFLALEQRGTSSIDAEAELRDIAGVPANGTLAQVVRAARRVSHPDVNGGMTSQWECVQHLAEVVGHG